MDSLIGIYGYSLSRNLNVTGYGVHEPISRPNDNAMKTIEWRRNMQNSIWS